MTMFDTKVLSRTAASIALAASLGLATAASASEESHIERHHWSFAGFFGQFEQAQLQRGFAVYKSVCANCHGLTRIAFRNLAEKGGPDFPAAGVQTMAAKEFKVEDGPNDDGKMFMRPAKLSDHFPPVYKNDQEARSIHNGALPPDLSLITKARNVETVAPWYIHPFLMLRDMFIGYQEGGADYVRALMVGYGDPPAYVRDAAGKLVALKEGATNAKAERCVSVMPVEGKPDVCNPLLDGMQYNSAFPGGQIAMPPPLSDGAVDYTDGTPAKVENYAEDVSAFLSWAGDPTLEARKRLGWQVILYLVVTSILLFIGKKRIWSKIPH
jgi:cytochrome c1